MQRVKIIAKNTALFIVCRSYAHAFEFNFSFPVTRCVYSIIIVVYTVHTAQTHITVLAVIIINV